MEGLPRQELDALAVPVQRTRRATVDVSPRCPTCDRPVCLRADVVTLASGARAIDAAGLRLALRVHLRRCDGH